ncbi:unnamed protein product [Acanthoscelides obtectus]|uniref:Uncharacterized protein n=1 Tax=Acanthoscelides obtectus TaxID=200917 RepID=A0A9P0PDA3_ACAOB|nr:unnamed protein product [Acanthoscelides obtectus]CAK1644525.1 hypothetical protein AOBTE_LOCUS13856 [Acanthoscelides obtectus]
MPMRKNWFDRGCAYYQYPYTLVHQAIIQIPSTINTLARWDSCCCQFLLALTLGLPARSFFPYLSTSSVFPERFTRYCRPI